MATKEQLRHRSATGTAHNGSSNYHHHRSNLAMSSSDDGIERRASQSQQDGIDEEHGGDNYELTSSLLPDKQGKGAADKSKSNKIKVSIKHGNDDHNEGDADETKNNTDDVRSRRLFLQTAFWITCWYGTSLATLFLNKIILSRPGASVHVLGMCQMTTAAVLGGWSAYGGAEWVHKQISCLWGCLPESVRGRLFAAGFEGTVTAATVSGGSSASGGERQRRHLKEKQSTVSGQEQQKEPATPSKSTKATTSGVGFHFVRDMSIVGLLRGLTVVLGLIALEHVPVSFVETIKATAPAFTVVFARLILQERTATPVMLTLIPVVAGLILCSASELRFEFIGFVAAVANNCADCVQNVMSKRMLAHLKPTQLQFYTSVAALMLQTPFVLRDAGMLLRSWASSESEDSVLDLDDADPSFHQISMGKLLLVDAIFYHLQSVSAYCTMGCMSPVSQSVANTLKRALLVWASILYFGNPVTTSGVLGVIMVVSGVFLYNHVRRIHQS
eukprot:g5535.t1 g5535   contig2:727806-729308(+)